MGCAKEVSNLGLSRGRASVGGLVRPLDFLVPQHFLAVGNCPPQAPPTNPLPPPNKPRHTTKPSKIRDVNVNTLACRCPTVSQRMTLSDAGPAATEQRKLQHPDVMRALTTFEPGKDTLGVLPWSEPFVPTGGIRQPSCDIRRV